MKGVLAKVALLSSHKWNVAITRADGHVVRWPRRKPGGCYTILSNDSHHAMKVYQACDNFNVAMISPRRRRVGRGVAAARKLIASLLTPLSTSFTNQKCARMIASTTNWTSFQGRRADQSHECQCATAMMPYHYSPAYCRISTSTTKIFNLHHSRNIHNKEDSREVHTPFGGSTESIAGLASVVRVNWEAPGFWCWTCLSPLWPLRVRFSGEETCAQFKFGLCANTCSLVRIYHRNEFIRRLWLQIDRPWSSSADHKSSQYMRRNDCWSIKMKRATLRFTESFYIIGLSVIVTLKWRVDQAYYNGSNLRY